MQLCDVPDLELFPELFQADTVVFKAGVELTLLNYALAVLGQLRQFQPALEPFLRLAAPVRRALALRKATQAAQFGGVEIQ